MENKKMKMQKKVEKETVEENNMENHTTKMKNRMEEIKVKQNNNLYY